MAEAGGLRERKKQQTRDAIIDAALDLFERQGFEATTIAQIAEAADIAPRTFFGYFPSKEDVVFYDVAASLESFATAVRERGEGVSTLAALRAWILDEGHHERDPADRDVCRDRVLADSPSLRAREADVMRRFEEVLAEGIADDLGDTPDGLRPRMVAAAASAALDAMKPADPADPLPADEAVAVLDEGFAFLESGLAALRRGSPA